MKAYGLFRNKFQVPNPSRTKNLTRVMFQIALSYHSFIEPPPSEPLSSEWREKALPKLIKLTPLLKNLDLINGRLVNLHDKSTVKDEFLLQSMHTFKSLGSVFLVYQSIQQTLSLSGKLCLCVNNKPIYIKPIALDSLKKVCDILDISPQQRKLVRLAICPQVTQHQIWTHALEEILNQLKFEMGVKDYMAKQIVVNCLSFLNDAMSYDPDSTSWMRLAPKKDSNFPPSTKWADFLEMLNDLINCLKNDDHDREFFFYVTKLESMKEGLLQIKDVLVDKNIGYKEARHQENLVQKKLSKSLGHSSRCLFTLLLYYLYGSVREIELDICCWFSDIGGEDFCLCVGKILTSDGEKMLKREVKKLERAIRVLKFVYEMAEMKEVLEVQGHIWCVGFKNRSVTYRGQEFFIHGINL